MPYASDYAIRLAQTKQMFSKFGKGQMIMYVYIRSESNLYTVGFYSPDGKWHAESDHESDKRAAERVHYLNGGRATEDDPDEADSGSWGEYQHIKAQQRTADYSDQCSSDLPF